MQNLKQKIDGSGSIDQDSHKVNRKGRDLESPDGKVNVDEFLMDGDDGDFDDDDDDIIDDDTIEDDADSPLPK